VVQLGRKFRLGRKSVDGWTAVRFDHRSVGQDLARVVEDDDTVAEQAPALLTAGSDDAGGLSVDGIGGGTRGLVLAHQMSPVEGSVMIHNDGDEGYLNSNESGSSGVTASH
jgi:hypothetical protein